MLKELPLRIILQKPPAGLDYALQKGSGLHYQIVQTQRSAGNDLQFSFTIEIKNLPWNHLMAGI